MPDGDDDLPAVRRRLSRVERIASENRAALDAMGVFQMSERERGSIIHVARWWVRGLDNRTERRRALAAIGALVVIVGPAISAVITHFIH